MVKKAGIELEGKGASKHLWAGLQNPVEYQAANCRA
jgi:hypothetical protein